MTSAIEKRPACSAIVAWNSTWYSTVAELLDERVLGRRVVRVERLERVDELERLLDEVRHEAGVGLLAVPRAPLAQRAGELVEADVAGADGTPRFGT